MGEQEAGERARVLVIDDDVVDAEILRRLAAKAVRRVIEVEHETGLAAGTDRLSAGGFDVLFLDLNLPESRGLDTLDHVLEADSGVPVVVLTALATTRSAKKRSPRRRRLCLQERPQCPASREGDRLRTGKASAGGPC